MEGTGHLFELRHLLFLNIVHRRAVSHPLSLGLRRTVAARGGRGLSASSTFVGRRHVALAGGGLRLASGGLRWSTATTERLASLHEHWFRGMTRVFHVTATRLKSER